MSQRVLDIEVILVVKDRDGLGLGGKRSVGGGRGRGIVTTLRRDGDGGQVNLLRHLDVGVRRCRVWWSTWRLGG